MDNHNNIDVLHIRERHMYNHAGNVTVVCLYARCGERDKMRISMDIVAAVREVGVGGRFLSYSISMKTMWILGTRRPWKRLVRLRDAGRNEIVPVGIPTPHVDKTNEAIQESHSIYSVTSSRVVLVLE
eukprot:scaffold5793_cov92-Skeletonema_dohrnii-CCMP3373.AAC.3